MVAGHLRPVWGAVSGRLFCSGCGTRNCAEEHYEAELDMWAHFYSSCCPTRYRKHGEECEGSQDNMNKDNVYPDPAAWTCPSTFLQHPTCWGSQLSVSQMLGVADRKG